MEAAIPPYRSDTAAAALAVGELYLYVKQLTSRVTELAEQANGLDDALAEAVRRTRELEEQLASAHTRNADLSSHIAELEAETDCHCGH